MNSVMPYGAVEVLERAAAILESGPLTGDDAEHGPYCVRCAVAKAKGQLDGERGVRFSPPETDFPLVAAREALRAVGHGADDATDRDGAVRLLRDAVAGCQA
jgi:hypothetical protein